MACRMKRTLAKKIYLLSLLSPLIVFLVGLLFLIIYDLAGIKAEDTQKNTLTIIGNVVFWFLTCMCILISPWIILGNVIVQLRLRKISADKTTLIQFIINYLAFLILSGALFICSFLMYMMMYGLFQELKCKPVIDITSIIIGSVLLGIALTVFSYLYFSKQDLKFKTGQLPLQITLYCAAYAPSYFISFTILAESLCGQLLF